MCAIAPRGEGWVLQAPEPVGHLPDFLARLRSRAAGAAVALGLDCPLGLPRAYAKAHAPWADFPAFLRALPGLDQFLQVAASLEEVSPMRPFYPASGRAGMTRAAHARALGLEDASALCRRCDMATADRPAGAPAFWTLGANQSGKAAISAWRGMICPALAAGERIRLWPFEGPYRSLLEAGAVAIAETYPAEAMRQLGLRRAGSKRRREDRVAYGCGLTSAMEGLGVVPEEAAARAIGDGFGADLAGEDRLDCVLGALCVLSVVSGVRPDAAPGDPWILTWEGWVLGQSSLPRKEGLLF